MGMDSNGQARGAPYPPSLETTAGESVTFLAPKITFFGYDNKKKSLN